MEERGVRNKVNSGRKLIACMYDIWRWRMWTCCDREKRDGRGKERKKRKEKWQQRQTSKTKLVRTNRRKERRGLGEERKQRRGGGKGRFSGIGVMEFEEDCFYILAGQCQQIEAQVRGMTDGLKVLWRGTSRHVAL